MKKPSTLILMLGLLFINPGCGTEVGNSGKPISSESTDLASLVGMQHDEVISSVEDENGQDSEALALRALGGESLLALNCEVNADGSLEITRDDSLERQYEFGRPANRKVLTDTLVNNLAMTYEVPAELGVLSCSAAQRPVISWQQLISLKTTAVFDKNRQRSVTLKTDGTVLNQSTLIVSSQREVQYAKVSASLNSLTTRRTSTFTSNVQLQRSSSTSTLSRSIQTVSAEPLIVEKTRTRGSGVTAMTIVSGAVSSTRQDEKKIILRYKNLVLGVGDSCHPTSGSISGLVYAATTDAEAESSFVVEFSSDGAIIHYEDDSEEDLELEACQIQ